jgi:hypothetical protein
METLVLVLSLFQILGLFLIIIWQELPPKARYLISLCGLAAVIKLFVLPADQLSVFNVIVAAAGLGLMVLGHFMAQQNT